jgi:integrase
MATFELRKDAEGQVKAIRVKVRRVGQPHLSRTFAVVGKGAKAVATARKEAEAWATGLASAMRDVVTELVQAPASAEAPVAQAFHGSAGRAGGPSPADASDALARRALQALQQGTGLNLDELQALRWQHVGWHARTLDVPGESGLTVRQVPLDARTVEALLAIGARKHGLIFPGGRPWLMAQLAERAERAGNARPSTPATPAPKPRSRV